jgi:hypothetical protein
LRGRKGAWREAAARENGNAENEKKHYLKKIWKAKMMENDNNGAW